MLRGPKGELPGGVHFVGHDLYGSWFPVLGLLESDFSSLNVLFEGVL